METFPLGGLRASGAAYDFEEAVKAAHVMVNMISLHCTLF